MIKFWIFESKILTISVWVNAIFKRKRGHWKCIVSGSLKFRIFDHFSVLVWVLPKSAQSQLKVKHWQITKNRLKSFFFTFWMIYEMITRLVGFYNWVLRTRIRDERTRHSKRDFLASDLTRYKVRQEYWVMDGEICPCSCGTNKQVEPTVNGYKWIMVPE